MAAIGLALALVSGADGQEAKALAAQGVREYVEGRYADAARDLLASYELVPVPILLFNLGQCARATGHLDDAIDFYVRYLHAAPNAPNVAAARSNLREAEEAKKRPVPGMAEPLRAAEPVRERPRELLPDVPLAPPQNPSPVPAEAVSEAPNQAGHSHWLGASLAAAAAVCLGFTIVGVVREVQYDNAVTAKNWAQFADEQAEYVNAQNWEYAAVALGIAAVGGTAAAVLTW